MSKLVFKWSQIRDGNMSLKYGNEVIVKSNREKFLNKLGVDAGEMVVLSLLGGTEIIEVNKGDIGKMLEADAAITNEVGVGLFMVVGDCFPVVVFDPIKNVLALVHLGYAGISGGLAGKVIERMHTANLIIKIGPGARKESYKFLQQEVRQNGIDGWKDFLENDGQMTKIDLIGYLKKQFRDMGVKPENIEDCGIDTISDTKYFSHYRSKRNGEPEARFGVVAMIKE